MSRLLFVDAIGGAAGDMLLAALLDTGAPIENVQSGVDAALPGRYRLRTEDVRRGGYRAKLLRIEPVAGTVPARHTLRGLRERVASLAEPLRARATAVVERLGEAEARVHGLDPQELASHAIGDDDSLIDVVGIVAALEALAIGRIFVSSLPLGVGGAVTGLQDHPDVPLPAPAAVELLRGFAVRGATAGEFVTPTAAAVFAALGEPAGAFPSMVIEGVGYGAGTHDPGDRPNVVRVFSGTAAAEGGDEGLVLRELVVLEANLDDLTPELVADAAEALRVAGALDVWSAPVQMKKGRPGVVLSALGEPSVEARLRDVFFHSTSTFGVRATRVARTELERRVVSVPLGEGTVRVKIGLHRGRVVTAKPEHDDVAELAARSGRPVREIHEEAALAARALRLAPSPEGEP